MQLDRQYLNCFDCHYGPYGVNTCPGGTGVTGCKAAIPKAVDDKSCPVCGAISSEVSSYVHCPLMATRICMAHCYHGAGCRYLENRAGDAFCAFRREVEKALAKKM